MDNSEFVITIGRQFGSGGHEVGRILAEKLGVSFYDKELVYQSANLIGVEERFLANSDEKVPSFIDSIFSSPVGFGGDFYLLGGYNQEGDNYNIIADTIRRIAQQESSVMVGRTADYLLREHSCCVSLFIHASMEKRVERIMARVNGISADEAEARAIKNDRSRAEYYNFYTNKNWGVASSYDLSIDSTKISCEQVADIVIEYLKCRIV